MENKAGIFPLSMDRKFKCSFCDSYLSIPPITIISLEGDKWKCGRCAWVTTQYNIPELLFETVASFMTFPCVYPDCPVEIPWKGVKEHEENCRYQTIKCYCGKILQLSLLRDHFFNQHQDNMNYHQAVIRKPEFKKLYTRLIITKYTDICQFMVYILCDRETEIKVGVFALQQTKEPYEVQLKIASNFNNSVVTLHCKNIFKFNQQKNCADCLLKSCTYHKYCENNQNLYSDRVDETMNIRVDTTSVLNALCSDDFTLTITIHQGDPMVKED